MSIFKRLLSSVFGDAHDASAPQLDGDAKIGGKIPSEGVDIQMSGKNNSFNAGGMTARTGASGGSIRLKR
ncbi:MAG: hypothetical protein VXY16_10590 [Pseudomonadota bacterium]|nr:hypothetical protein [Pseudomonadota bacterium]